MNRYCFATLFLTNEKALLRCLKDGQFEEINHKKIPDKCPICKRPLEISHVEVNAKTRTIIQFQIYDSRYNSYHIISEKEI